MGAHGQGGGAAADLATRGDRELDRDLAGLVQLDRGVLGRDLLAVRGPLGCPAGGQVDLGEEVEGVREDPGVLDPDGHRGGVVGLDHHGIGLGVHEAEGVGGHVLGGAGLENLEGGIVLQEDHHLHDVGVEVVSQLEVEGEVLGLVPGSHGHGGTPGVGQEVDGRVCELGLPVGAGCAGVGEVVLGDHRLQGQRPGLDQVVGGVDAHVGRIAAARVAGHLDRQVRQQRGVVVDADAGVVVAAVPLQVVQPVDHGRGHSVDPIVVGAGIAVGGVLQVERVLGAGPVHVDLDRDHVAHPHSREEGVDGGVGVGAGPAAGVGELLQKEFLDPVRGGLDVGVVVPGVVVVSGDVVVVPRRVVVVGRAPQHQRPAQQQASQQHPSVSHGASSSRGRGLYGARGEGQGRHLISEPE